MSEAVSPTTMIVWHALTCDLSAHTSTMSGAGRPRPASAGETRNSKRSDQPRMSISASRVAGEKPVVSATACRDSQVSTVARAPGTSLTPTSFAAAHEVALEGVVGVVRPVRRRAR